MDETLQRLLQAVWDAPEDDFLRAITADRLADLSDPREELLRQATVPLTKHSFVALDRTRTTLLTFKQTRPDIFTLLGPLCWDPDTLQAANQHDSLTPVELVVHANQMVHCTIPLAPRCSFATFGPIRIGGAAYAEDLAFELKGEGSLNFAFVMQPFRRPALRGDASPPQPTPTEVLEQANNPVMFSASLRHPKTSWRKWLREHNLAPYRLGLDLAAQVQASALDQRITSKIR